MTNPFAPPVERTSTSLAPFKWGAGVFLVVNFALNHQKCPFSITSDLGCDRSINVWMVEAVLAVAFGLKVLAGRGGASRQFVWGFVFALVALATLTLGHYTFVWAEPVRALAATTGPFRTAVGDWRRRDEARELWIGMMAGRQPRIPAATDLAAMVYRCATGRVEGQDGRAIPRDQAEISIQCPALWPNNADATTVRFPDRYRVPGYLGGPKDPPVATANTLDEGWRWKFSLTPSAVRARPARFDVTVAPDEDLAFDWPRVSIDERALIRAMTGAGATPLTVSPVPDLLMMHECLRDIPAAHERRTRGRQFASQTWSIYGMVHILCPQLVPRVKRAGDDDYGNMMLSVELPAGPRESPAKVAEYLVSIDVDETLPSFGFFLIATSINETRHYLMTPDGSVHATSEPRPATTDDPTAERCEVTLDAPC